MNDTRNARHAQYRMLLFIIPTILAISFFVSSSYRGIAHDEGIGGFHAGAKRFLEQQPIFYDIEEDGTVSKIPARFVYISLISLSYKILGINLLSLHIFPYLAQIINPCLFFFIVTRFFKNIWWGLGGALLLIFQPFTLVYLNQQHTHPIFVFFLLLLVLLFQNALDNPKFLILFGSVASLLLLTRLTDGILFVALLYTVYVVERWKKGIPVQWLLISVGACLLTYGVFGFLFDFSVLYPFYYLPNLFKRQEAFKGELSSYQLTTRALRNFFIWYFCGKFVAPLLVILAAIGAVIQAKKRILYPLALYAPYFLFLTFVFNARDDVGHMEPTAFTVPGFLLLLLGGIQGVSYFASCRISRTNTKGVFLTEAFWGSMLILLILIGFGRATYSLARIAEDSHPASSMWRIVKNNPPLPGNPAYRQSYIRLTRNDRISVRLREQLYKSVRGSYRSWYLHRVGRDAFEQGLPELSRSQADFSYYDEYESKSQWEADRYRLEGTSPLWHDSSPGRIGAFPVGEHGSFVYKFDLPKPIDDVIISDIHTQWGFGDITKMWTSTDGEHWTLRHHNWNVLYRKDYYYQFFDEEFDGHTSIFIKYYFKAGDKSRAEHDNRGASLQEFSLSVIFR